MVKKIWTDPKFSCETGKQRRFVWKLKELNLQTKQWENIRNNKENTHLI
jgi:hypothetical protein